MDSLCLTLYCFRITYYFENSFCSIGSCFRNKMRSFSRRFRSRRLCFPFHLWKNLSSCTVEKVFFVFYPHTLTFCCNRLTDSNKGCEGKCEGSFFTLTLPLTTSPHAHYSSGRNASCLSRGFNGRHGSSGIPAV